MKKRRLLPLAVVAVLFVTLIAVSALAAETRASKYLESYQVLLVADGGGKMHVSYGVYGTREMSQIGVYELSIEEEVTPGRWIPYITVEGDDDPDTYYSYNSMWHEGSYYFDGIPGSRYRATMIAYAGNSTGSDTGDIVSAERNCK